MKSWKLWILWPAMVFLFIGFWISGCGKKGSSSNTATTPAPPPPPLTGSLSTGDLYTWESYLNITDKGAYRDFLKDTRRVCDLYNIVNFFNSNCEAWDDYGYIYVRLIGTTLPAQGDVVIVASNGNMYNGIPLQFYGDYNAINSNAGFQFSPVSAGYISVVIDPGLPTDGSLNIKVKYNNREFGSATVRYNEQLSGY